MHQHLSVIKDWFVASTHAVKISRAVSTALRFCATMVGFIAAKGWSLAASRYTKCKNLLHQSLPEHQESGRIFPPDSRSLGI